MTYEKLQTNTRKELAALAKRHHVNGWHGMRKDELIEALLDVHRSRSGDARSVRSVARVKPQKQNPRPAESPKPAAPAPAASAPRPASPSRPAVSAVPARPVMPTGRPAATAANRLTPGGNKAVRKDLSTGVPADGAAEELTAVAHDPYWIHARWVLRRGTIQRAEAALGSDWFRAVPVIRVFALDVDDVKGVNARWVRDVEIHGECDHWFVPVENPPGIFKLQIGYLAGNGRFFALAKSRRVTTPRPGSKAAERCGWNRSATTSPAMYKPGVSRGPVTDPQFEKFLAARAVSYAMAVPSNGHGSYPFSIDAELLVSGTAHPNAQLTLQGETLRVGRDGKFTLRVSLTEGRQVIPAVAVSPDGTEQRTIILSIDRNTKELEPLQLDDAV